MIQSSSSSSSFFCFVQHKISSTKKSSTIFKRELITFCWYNRIELFFFNPHQIKTNETLKDHNKTSAQSKASIIIQPREHMTDRQQRDKKKKNTVKQTDTVFEGGSSDRAPKKMIQTIIFSLSHTSKNQNTKKKTKS